MLELVTRSVQSATSARSGWIGPPAWPRATIGRLVVRRPNGMAGERPPRSPFLKKCLVSRAFDGVEVSGLCGRDVEGVGMWAR